MSTTRFYAYRPLIKNLLLPLGIMKFLLAFILVIFVCALWAIWFNKGQSTAVNAMIPMLLTLMILYFSILAMVLPHQALTMISSKSLRYLVDFRKFYFVIAFLFSLKILLIVVISVVYKEHDIKFDDLYLKSLQIWVVVSAYVIVFFVVTYRFPLLQFLICGTFFFIPYILAELSRWHHAQLIGLLVGGWSTFAFWWLKLKPQKKHANVFDQSMEHMMGGNAVNSSPNWLINFLAPSSKSTSFLGTRLVGMPDSFAAIIRYWIFIGFITLVLLVFLEWLIKDKVEDYIKNTGMYFFMFIVFASSSGIMVGVCRNIKYLWLYFPGSRNQMFQFVERNSLNYSGKIMLGMPIMALVTNASVGFAVISLSAFVWIAVSVVLMNALMFYLAISIYSRDDDSKTPAGVLIGMVVFSSVMLLVIFNFLLTHDHYNVVALLLTLAFLLGIYLRTRLIKKWQHINFVRVI